EQLEDIKHFWKQYGNLITWTLVLALGAFAAWQGWNRWQLSQSEKASAMYDELERVAGAGDAARAAQVFAELRERYPRPACGVQGAGADGGLPSPRRSQAHRTRRCAGRRSDGLGGVGGGQEMKARRTLAAALALAALLLGCSSDKPKPAALESITPQIGGRQI